MENPTFHLEGIVKGKDELTDFEGPLSLILMLLSKNKIEIRDISVSEILDQYLAYIRGMQEMDIEVASEFVQMAAYLLFIKTKTLLDSEKEVTELEQLMSSLEKLRCKDVNEAVRTVIPQFAEATEKGLRLYTRPQEPLRPAAKIYDYRHDPADLLRCLFSVFSRAGTKPPGPPEIRSLAPKRIVYSVKEKCGELYRQLEAAGHVGLRSLFLAAKSRTEMVATFIAVLEMCAVGSVAIDDTGEEPALDFIGGGIENIVEDFEE